MLIRLEINNLAVISDSVFEPSYGLNVISGETGAGKSLLIDAIGLIIGFKASKSLIRSDKDFAYVEAVFDLSDVKDPYFYELLNQSGIETDEGLLIISRKINSDGKSLARINGRTVVLTVLREIASFLIDIHGQHDTQQIFDEKSHVAFLDSFGGEDISVLKEAYTEELKAYKDIVLKIRNMSQSPEFIKNRKEYLSFAIEEITNANLKVGEEEELQELKNKLRQSEKYATNLSEATNLLNSDSDGLSPVQRLNMTLAALKKISDIDDSYTELMNRAESVFLDLEALASDVKDSYEDLSFDSNLKEKTDSRIGLIYDLKSKYGDSIDEINEFLTNAKAELDSLDDRKKILSDLKHERVEKEASLLKAAKALSDKRKEYSEKLSKLIVSELKELEMENAVFDVEFKERSKEKYFASYGTEDISFVFSANPGQALRSLSEIVSGGEASRIMLAIKTILSSCDLIPTLIFDEIDTGVSGKAATSIARKLKTISKHHQVLCVSHTSQMAAAANNNYLLTKVMDANSTVTDIKTLDKEGKALEVSRLLSGTDTKESLELANKLINSFD